MFARIMAMIRQVIHKMLPLRTVEQAEKIETPLSAEMINALDGCFAVMLESNYDEMMLMFGGYPTDLKFRIIFQFAPVLFFQSFADGETIAGFRLEVRFDPDIPVMVKG